MTSYASPPTPPLDAAGNVVVDLPCRKCAYNLRTLSINGRCPECGTAVGFSAQGDLLRFSDPGWVMTLHRGVVLILAGIAVIILGVLLAVLIGFTGAVTVTAVVAGAAGLVGYVLILIGTWLLTAPDPSGLGEDRYGTSRKLIRITMLIGLASQALELIEAGFTLPATLAVLFAIVQFLAGIAGVVGVFAQLQYIGKLAMRIPDEQIVGRANFLKIAIAVSYGLIVLIGTVTALGARGAGAGAPPGGLIAALGCFAAIVGLAFLVFAIMYLLMLDRLRRALKEQAQYATQTWAAGAAPQVARA
jgi:hypothetical protein